MFCAIAAHCAPAKTAAKLTPAEAKAAAILRDVDAEMKKHKTMTADFLVFGSGKSRHQGSFKAMKPNYSLVRYRDLLSKKPIIETNGSDGKHFWTYPLVGDVKEYSKRKLEQDEKIIAIQGAATFPADAFFGIRYALYALEIEDIKGLKYIGEQQWNGALYRVLQHDKIGKRSSNKYRLTNLIFVDSDNVVKRHVVRFAAPNKKNPQQTRTIFQELQLSNIKFDAPMTPQQFTIKVPAGIKQWKGLPEDLLKQEMAKTK